MVLLVLSGCSHLSDFATDPDYAVSVSERAGVDFENERKTSDSDSEPAVRRIRTAAHERPATRADSFLNSSTEGEISLTLSEALGMALDNNSHIRVMAFVPEGIATQIPMEQAQFDPVFAAGGQWHRANEQVASAIQAFGTGLDTFQTSSLSSPDTIPNQLQVEKRWSTGTRTRLGYNTNYTNNTPGGQFLVVNPAYRSSMNLTVEQPLFQGWGREQNLIGLRIARINYNQSMDEFQTEVNRILLDVQSAYWEAYRARAEVDSLKDIVQQADVMMQKERRRLEIGQGSAAEAAQARESLESLRAEMARARHQFRDSVNRLKALLGINAQDRRLIQFSDAPRERPFEPDLEWGLSSARQNRPEFAAQRYAIQALQLDLDRRRNADRPDVSVVAGYALAGLSNGVLGSLDRLASTEFGNWTLGLTYQQPLGRRAARAAVQQADLQLRHRRAVLEELDEQIANQVMAAHDAILGSYEVLQRQKSRRDAARIRFDTVARRHEAGELDLDQYVRSQAAYAEAVIEELVALVEYNLALAQWDYAIGQISWQQPSDAPRPAPPAVAQDESDEIVPASAEERGERPRHSSLANGPLRKKL